MQALSEAMQGDRAQKQALIDDYMAQIAVLNDKIAAADAQIVQLAQAAEDKRHALREAAEHRAQTEARRNQTEKLAQEKNQSILLLERESARLEQKKATAELEQKQLVDKLWDSYELTPSTAEAPRRQTAALASCAGKFRRWARRIWAQSTSTRASASGMNT